MPIQIYNSFTTHKAIFFLIYLPKELSILTLFRVLFALTCYIDSAGFMLT